MQSCSQEVIGNTGKSDENKAITKTLTCGVVCRLGGRALTSGEVAWMRGRSYRVEWSRGLGASLFTRSLNLNPSVEPPMI